MLNFRDLLKREGRHLDVEMMVLIVKAFSSPLTVNLVVAEKSRGKSGLSALIEDGDYDLLV